jgi:hypothetical protein
MMGIPYAILPLLTRLTVPARLQLRQKIDVKQAGI